MPTRQKTKKGLAPFLMVGYNRRFAPVTQKLKQFFAGHQEPMVVQIRVNAGYIPHDHCMQQNSSGGGRILGELCCLVDWARCVVDCGMVSVAANALADGARGTSQRAVRGVLVKARSDASAIFAPWSFERDGRTISPRMASRVSSISRSCPLSRLAFVHRILPSRAKELMDVSEATIAIEEAIASGEVVSLHATPVSALRKAAEKG